MNITVKNGKTHPFISVLNGNQVSYNLENDIVHAFMEDDHYPDGYAASAKTSLVRPYEKFVNESSHASWTEITRPVLLFGDGDTVVLTTDGKSLSYPMIDGYAKIYNLVPKCSYTWKMFKNNIQTKSGSFTTEGTVRMILLGDAINCRDIGGYACEGGHVAYGKLIRGIQIDNATYDSPEPTELRRLGITAELDLRLKNKRYTKPSIGLNYYGTLYNASQTVTSDKYGLTAGYSPVLTNPKNVNNCLTVIANEIENGGGVFFHCKAGADRTGTLAVIILGLLGVSEDNMVKDWEMTSLSCWYNFKRIDTEYLTDYPKGEMRSFFKNVKAYKGNNFQEKITWWLINKASVKQELIDKLKSLLIVKD